LRRHHSTKPLTASVTSISAVITPINWFTQPNSAPSCQEMP
jgi:hypothetical protein